MLSLKTDLIYSGISNTDEAGNHIHYVTLRPGWERRHARALESTLEEDPLNPGQVIQQFHLVKVTISLPGARGQGKTVTMEVIVEGKNYPFLIIKRFLSWISRDFSKN